MSVSPLGLEAEGLVVIGAEDPPQRGQTFGCRVVVEFTVAPEELAIEL